MSRARVTETAFVGKDSVPGGIRYRARIGLLRSFRSFLLGTVVLVIVGSIYVNLDHGPAHSQAQRAGVLAFLCIPFAIGGFCLVHGVQRFRNRLDVLILEDRIEASQTGLLRRKADWSRGNEQRYYLVVTYRDQVSAESLFGDPKGGGASKARKVRVANLDMVDHDANRTRLIKKFNGWQPMMELAKLIAESQLLPPPVVIDLAASADEETAFRDAHVAHADS